MNTRTREIILTIFLILASAGVLTIKPAQEISMSPLGGDKIDTLLNIISYLILFYFLLIHWKKFLYVITKNPLQFLLLGIVLFSLLWSEDLSNALNYVRGIIRIYLIATYLAIRYTLKEQMRFMALALGLGASLSLFFSRFMGGYIHVAPELAGMWSGIYGHKNELGYMMAWSTGVFLHLGLSINRYRWLMWILCGVSLCLIIFSRSTTSLAIVLTMVLLLPFYNFLKKTNYKLQVMMMSLGLMLLICFSLVLMSHIETLVGTSGKDLTLNGRSDLWAGVISKVWERPWFGYGYYGFWNSPNASNLRATYEWASNSHNGFLDLLLDLGFFGFIVFAVGFMRCFFMALSRITSIGKKPEDYWPVQMLILIVIVNFTEARLLTPSWNWLMYVTTALSLTVEYQRNRQVSTDKLTLITVQNTFSN
ncbi:O-antigen ligase family protein [Anabaena azotica]|uniref:O-antigen ligase family protein n=1 Tax=Anabaena azotica FACHB-119 TaxID=947527 RepID=A0ABR8DAP9_9NOST|nr:O-antigen ligase [Anabaena azotica]MBD2504257.1 O-antigen ligase family protein [Anabaena azotica FACHB-119]